MESWSRAGSLREKRAHVFAKPNTTHIYAKWSQAFDKLTKMAIQFAKLLEKCFLDFWQKTRMQNCWDLRDLVKKVHII
jgi:hypothetical protein